MAEHNVRTGFFEPDDYRPMPAHLPDDVRPAVRFAYLTVWRMKSEVLSLTWKTSTSRLVGCASTLGRPRIKMVEPFRLP